MCLVLFFKKPDPAPGFSIAFLLFNGRILLTVSLGGVFIGHEVSPQLFFGCFYSGSRSASKMRIRIREASDCGSDSGSGLPLQTDGIGTSKLFALSVRRFCSKLDINYGCVVKKFFLGILKLY